LNNIDFTDYICETCCGNCWECDLSRRFTDRNYVFDSSFLDSKNIRQMAFIDDFQQILVSAWMAFNDVDNDEDFELFRSLMLDNLISFLDYNNSLPKLHRRE